ncbi:MAG: hypothetical protein ACRDQG_02045 [Pseudonocardiaceae bacterium]
MSSFATGIIAGQIGIIAVSGPAVPATRGIGFDHSLLNEIWKESPMRPSTMTENTETLDQPIAVNTGDFDLDVSIVESGDAAQALLGSTDNGCDTQKQGDC